MKQSICYLYEYENNKQIKNVGFLKCIFQKSKVTFQIHGKGLDCDKFMDLEMFLFVNDNGYSQLDRVGVVEGRHGKVNYIVSVDDMDEKRFLEYDGIVLESRKSKKYVGTWKNKEVILEKNEAPLNLAGEVQPNLEAEAPPDLEEVQLKLEDDENQVDAEDDEIELAEERLQATVHAEIEADLDEVEGNGHDGIKYEKIDRDGIAGLPQREWKLANNHFLLHGLSNYNHLMLIRENHQLFLGVPGIYHQKEEVAAKSFGFPLFHVMNGEKNKQLDMEQNGDDVFGYWCRPVAERRRMDMRYGRNEGRS